MRSIYVKGLMLTAVCVLGITDTVLKANAQEEKKSIQREIGIMSRVLGESLSDDISGTTHMFAGASPFDSKIESSYIPTVGAIFTLSVGYPLRETKEEPNVERPQADENEDLWERYAERRARMEDRSGSRQRGEDMRDQYREESRNIVIQRYTRSQNPNISIVDGVLRVDGPAYSAERVEALRHRVIDTLARYGHKLSSLPDDERILVIVEAARSSNSLRIIGDRYREEGRLFRPENRRNEQRRPPRPQPEGRGPHDEQFRPGEGGPGEPPRPPRQEGLGIADESLRPAQPPRPPRPPRPEPNRGMAGQIGSAGQYGSAAQHFLAGFGERRKNRDRILFSVQKADLTDGLTHDDLAGDITEVAY